MDLSTYAGNKLIDLLRGTAWTAPAGLYLSAHTADPGLTGTSEVGTAGSNGYSRQALALSAASGKATANTAQIQITMPSTLASNTPVPFLGVWDAATGGNFICKVPIGTVANFEASAATTDLISTGEVHGLAADDRVEFESIGGIMPTGLSAGTIYYVLASGLTTTDFKVSTTSGGSAVDITAAGGCIVRKLTVQAYNPSNILQVAIGALTLNV